MPIVDDKLAVRVSGKIYKRRSFNTRNGDGVNEPIDGRVKLLFKPTETFPARRRCIRGNKTSSPGVTINQVGPDEFALRVPRNRRWAT